MPKRIFIANRGEIVARIARTAAALGIETVAVAVRHAVPRFLAQEVTHLHLSGQESSDFYLDAKNIIALAQQHHCDALHPGYGFLAENADFAEQVSIAGLLWIGPAAQTIAQMGDKHAARQLARQAQVAVVPAVYIAADSSAAETEKALDNFNAQHGMPAIVKAVAGGGGKGMRVVHDAPQLHEAVQATAREAQTLYRNAALLVEKYITTPRHIEVQLVGDQQGQLIVLGERECSLQRRFQKIIEEAPATCLSDAQRQDLHAAAMRLGKQVSYYSTGTVEFLFDAEQGEFYFLEMNTRLQVEHTVTEEVYGVDLVAAQINIAAGASLDTLWSKAHTARGHSIQVRLYAEDATRDFLPSPGRVLAFTPYHGTGLRWEIGCEAGSEVSAFFDPMLAKLIATAESRELAIARLQQALARTFMAGVTTNLVFLQTLLAHKSFQQAQVSVNFVTHHSQQLLQTMRDRSEARRDDLAKIAAWLLENLRGKDHRLARIFAKTIDTSEDVVILSVHSEGDRQVGCGIYAGVSFFHFVQHQQAVTVGCAGHVHHAVREQGVQQAETQASAAGALLAPVPGRVAAVKVVAGDDVQEGTVCVIIESMKMEFALKAQGQGQVQAVKVKAGDLVSDGETLVMFA